MHTCVNSINNIDRSLADDRFIEALLCNWRHTVITVICTGRIRRPGPLQIRPGPARDLLFISRPGPARPGPRAARPVQISGLRHSILLITPHFFTDLSIPLVCPALSFLGFAPVLQFAHPLLKLTHHPHPPQQYPQVCPRALSLAHFFLFFSYHLLPM